MDILAKTTVLTQNFEVCGINVSIEQILSHQETGTTYEKIIMFYDKEDVITECEMVEVLTKLVDMELSDKIININSLIK